MAHVARIDDDGIVREVHVINNSDLPHNGEFLPEVEVAVNQFQHNLGLTGNWKLTSYNNNFRGRYAGIGFRYDEETDEFVPPGWEFIDGEWVYPEPQEFGDPDADPNPPLV